MLRLLRKGLWQMANQQWNVCIPFARSNSSVPIATVCWDGWCSYSNREATSMFTVKFLSHYLILLLPPSKFLKEEKNRISSLFEWIKIILKILKLKDSLQTTGAIICFPGTNCLIPWFPPHTDTGHCCFDKKKVVIALVNDWQLAVCSSFRYHCIQVQHLVIYKPVLPSSTDGSPSIKNWLGCFLSPTTHNFYPTTILKKCFYSENLEILTAIICLHLTVLLPYIIKREISHQVQKVLFKAQCLLIFSMLFDMWLPTG